MKHFLKYHLPFIAWALVIFIQSSFKAIEIPPEKIISLDKFLHMGVFGLLAGLCYISFIHIEKPNIFSSKPLIWTSVICILYGASDEIHQYFVPNRSAEVMDWGADVIGITIMCILINYFLKRRFVLFRKSTI